MSDELRNQLRRLDPMHPGVLSASLSQEDLEDIMTAQPTETTRPSRNRWYAVASVAAVAVALAIAVPALNADTAPTTTAVAAPPLVLSLGEGGGAMASCLMFDVAILADMPLAFEGTVTDVDGEKVTLAVDRWYTGGEAATVELTAPNGLQGLTGGFDFVADGQYLITATDGVVNYCGYSGPSTPEYRASFDEAFPG